MSTERRADVHFLKSKLPGTAKWSHWPELFSVWNLLCSISQFPLCDGLKGMVHGLETGTANNTRALFILLVGYNYLKKWKIYPVVVLQIVWVCLIFFSSCLISRCMFGSKREAFRNLPYIYVTENISNVLRLNKFKWSFWSTPYIRRTNFFSLGYIEKLNSNFDYLFRTIQTLTIFISHSLYNVGV